MARTAAGLPAGSRVTDFISIGVLASRFPRDVVDRVLAETGRRSQRERHLPAHVVVYYVIALALYMSVSYGEVLRCLVEGLSWLGLPVERIRATGRSGISQARARLGADPMRRIYEPNEDLVFSRGKPVVAGVANLEVAGHQPLLDNALERLLGKGRPQIIQVAKETLAGNLRGVLSQLAPEEVHLDKLRFAEKLLEEAENGLAARLALIDADGAPARADMEKRQAEARGKAAEIVDDGRATAAVLTQMIETWKAAFGVDLPGEACPGRVTPLTAEGAIPDRLADIMRRLGHRARGSDACVPWRRLGMLAAFALSSLVLSRAVSASPGLAGRSPSCARTIRWDYRILETDFVFVLTAFPAEAGRGSAPRKWTLSPSAGERLEGGFRFLSISHDVPTNGSAEFLYLLEAVRPEGRRYTLAAGSRRDGPGQAPRLVPATERHAYQVSQGLHGGTPAFLVPVPGRVPPEGLGSLDGLTPGAGPGPAGIGSLPSLDRNRQPSASILASEAFEVPFAAPPLMALSPRGEFDVCAPESPPPETSDRSPG